jgi:hypothetical protein
MIYLIHNIAIFADILELNIKIYQFVVEKTKNSWWLYLEIYKRKKWLKEKMI